MTVAQIARFWARVDSAIEGDGCWPWSGSKNGKGYGKLSVGGHLRYAHRVAWELTHESPIPDGMLVCHHCDNPPCCNPRHLFVGTYSDNNREAYAKGRKVAVVGRGERHPSAKFSEAQIVELRQRTADGEPVAQVARRLGISDTHARGVVAHQRRVRVAMTHGATA